MASLRWALVGLSLACFGVGVHIFVSAFDSFSAELLAYGTFWLLLSGGLWRMSRLARVVGQFLGWYVLIVVPFGVINPFMAINELGPNPPEAMELVVVWVLPWVVPALVAIHFLGKYKNHFGAVMPRRMG